MQFSKKSEKSGVGLALGGLLAFALGTAYLFQGSLHGEGVPVAEKSLSYAPQRFSAEGRDFVLIRDAKTGDQSRDYCRALGYELASVSTQVVMDALSDANTVGTTVVFIGLRMGTRDMNDYKANWYFLDGTPYDKETFPWESGQPSASGDCVYFHYSPGSTFYVRSCVSGVYFFVCETNVPNRGMRLEYWDTFVLVAAHGYGHSGARGFCERLGSQLAVVHSAEEQLEIAQVMQRMDVLNTWISVSRRNGFWMQEVKNKSLGYSLEPLAFEDFATGEKNAEGLSKFSRAVIRMDPMVGSPQWYARDYHDSDVAGFVCEGYNWALVHKGAAVSWKEADLFCKAEYSTYLASVRDWSTNEHMKDALQIFGSEAFIGLSDLQESEWRWVDDGPKTFVNWATDMPQAEDCVVLQPGTGHWATRFCDDANIETFFCAKLGAGENLCWDFVVVRASLSWAQAEDYCANEKGTHLASIHDAAENEKVQGCVVSAGLSSAWIGLRNDVAAAKQTYNWSDASARNYDNWAADDQFMNSHVEISVHSGEWYTAAGSVPKTGFVCSRT